MMRSKFLYVAAATLISTGAFFSSCSSDDDPMPPGNAVITVENVTTMKDFVQSGTFQMERANQPVILPGEAVTIKFHAARGQALMFATMYGYSNDVFFAPENPGIQLFNSDGNAITGNVSDKVKLWDNGTRINQVPGPSVNHPGTAEAGNITMINTRDPQNNEYLPASDLMNLTLAYTAATSEFTLTIRNTSGGTINETPFSPGVWVVSNKLGDNLVNDKPFFTPGAKSNDALTAIAEMGNNALLSTWVTERTGIITGLSPIVVAVYTGNTNPIYTLNQRDAGRGLKELAQKGDPATLRASLEGMSNVRRVYVVGTSALAPGEKAESTFEAREGDNIAYATMFGYSNDWFYANSETMSSTTKGDVTGRTTLLDSGTGVSQYPGAGNNQALFGGTPIAENNPIRVVTDTYPVPAVNRMIKVTLR